MPFFKKKNTESFINGSLDFKQLVDATHFLENHPDAVYTLNLDGYIVSFNQKLSLLLGYEGKKLQQQHFSDFLSPAEAARIAPFKQQALQGETVHFTAEVSHRNGHLLTMNVTNIPIYENRVIIGVYGIARDITQHIQLRFQHMQLSMKQQLTESIHSIAFLDYIPSTNRIFLSPHFASLLDVSKHRLTSMNYEEFIQEIHPDDRHLFKKQIELLQHGGTVPVSCQLRMNQQLLHSKYVQCEGLKFQDGQQDVFSFIFHTSPPLLHPSSAPPAASHSFFSRVETAIYQTEYESGQFFFFAHGFLQTHLSELEQIQHRPSTVHELIHPDDLPKLADANERILAGEQVQLTYRFLIDQEWTWLDEIRMPLRNEQDTATIGHQGIVSDITVFKQQEETIRTLSSFDQKTGLPNRLLFLEELEHRILRQSPCTLMALHFNQLDQVNAHIGYTIGDQWLLKTTELLQDYLPDAYCTRISGDHYALLLTDPFDESHLKLLCQKLLALNETRIAIDGYTIAPDLKIGINHFDGTETSASELMHGANRALTRATLNKRPGYEFYTSQLNLEMYRRHQLEVSLKQSIEREELFLEYQPKVDIWNGRLLSFEALIRWEHPEWGRIPPKDFIPLSEESDCYQPIGNWVIKTVCSLLQQLLRDDLPVVPISINVSPKQLLHSEFAKTIIGALQHHHVPSRLLKLEIPEHALLHDSELVKDTLRHLHQAGVQIILDSYGSGVSSLTSLFDYPLTSLKLDRSFAVRLTEDPAVGSFIKGITYFAKELNLLVVAEGVETLEQLDRFRDLECHAVQGYLFSRPVHADQIAPLLTQSTLQPMEAIHQPPKKPLLSLHGLISITRLNGKAITVGASSVLITRSTNRSVHFYASIRLPINHQIELSLQLTDVVHPRILIEPLSLTELDNGLFHYAADYKVRAQSAHVIKALEHSEQLKLDDVFLLS